MPKAKKTSKSKASKVAKEAPEEDEPKERSGSCKGVQKGIFEKRSR